MKPIHLAIGGLLVLLFGKATRPTSAPSSKKTKPAPAPSAQPPTEGTRTPSQTKPKLPKKPTSTASDPLDLASEAFTSAMRAGKDEKTARAEALAAYRKAGGRSSEEERRIGRWIFD